MTAESLRLLRLRDVQKLIPLSRSTIYARMETGSFPRPRDLGGGVVAWRECDIVAWLDSLPATGPAAH